MGLLDKGKPIHSLHRLRRTRRAVPRRLIRPQPLPYNKLHSARGTLRAQQNHEEAS